MTVERREGALVVADGARLHYRIWQPRVPRAGLVVAHGLAEHGGRYEALGRFLAGHDIAVLAVDLRGHGRSDGSRGHVRAFHQLLDDVLAARARLLAHCSTPLSVFVLGHSMGGLIAIRCIEEHPAAFAGAVMVSPWLETAMPVARWKTGLARLLARLLPALPFPAGIDASSLSRDPGIVCAYREDPLVHDRITPRLFVEASAAMSAAWERAERILLPVLFLLAGADRIVSTARAAGLAERLPPELTTVRVYDGHYHELLNEPTAASIRQDLRAWLDACIAASAARA